MGTDPYRLTDQTTPEPRHAGTDPTRLALWIALVVAAGLNAALSSVNVWLGTGFGVVVLALGVALIVNYRGKRRAGH
ncbi:hypothetical protein ACIA8K_18245 [Catenuloplanes sp. NPDC051500]|uniref:hypothetical protein n=1 Tax=Catenuloplanes sp. NPDC051500 TaxID=3363959 RepID=UPI00379E6009